jgi:hypothetical protein
MNLIVAKAQALIQNTIETPTKLETIMTALPSVGIDQANRFNLPTCIISKSVDHCASDCPKYQYSSSN